MNQLTCEDFGEERDQQSRGHSIKMWNHKLSRREKRKERRKKTSRQKIKKDRNAKSKADGSTCENADA